MRKLIFMLVGVVCFMSVVSAQERYESKKYPYSFIVPKTLEKKTPTVQSTDVVYGDKKGASFSVNVSERSKEEYGITAHDYSIEIFESAFKATLPGLKILKWEKRYVGGQEAFLIETVENTLPLQSICYYFYYKNQGYVINCTAEIGSFEHYRPIFVAVIESVKFK